MLSFFSEEFVAIFFYRVVLYKINVDIRRISSTAFANVYYQMLDGFLKFVSSLFYYQDIGIQHEKIQNISSPNCSNAFGKGLGCARFFE
jgi:hypothetical protein